MQVRVIDGDLGDRHYIPLAEYSVWELPDLPDDVLIEHGNEIEVHALPEDVASANGGRRLRLRKMSRDPSVVLSRMPGGGPVISSVEVHALDIASARSSVARLSETLKDGSQIWEVPIVAPDLRPGMTVQIAIIASGVAFLDGSLLTILGPNDFDAQGVAKVRFVRGATVESAVCHRISIFDGERLLWSR